MAVVGHMGDILIRNRLWQVQSAELAAQLIS